MHRFREGLWACMDKHWEDDDFAVVKVDVCNAFSRQANLDECALSLSFYLGPHGVVLLILLSAVSAHGSHLKKQVSNKVTPWALCKRSQMPLMLIMTVSTSSIKPGTLMMGPSQARICYLSWYFSIGFLWGIFVHLSKCEVFCYSYTSEFPPSMKSSHVPHLDIIARLHFFCAGYAASKRSEAMKLLSRLVEVEASDPQMALILLRLCGSYCKLIHLARVTSPSVVSELFGVEVKQCFVQSIAVEATDQQAQQNFLCCLYCLPLCFMHW